MLGLSNGRLSISLLIALGRQPSLPSGVTELTSSELDLTSHVV